MISIDKIKIVILNISIIFIINLSIIISIELIARVIEISKSVKIFDRRRSMKAYSYFDWKDDYFKNVKEIPFIYETYTLFKHKGYASKEINVTEEGFRVTINKALDKNKTSKKIYFLGGSTTFCLEVPDELTIASILSENLNKIKNKNYYTLKNYSVSAFVSDQEVILLTQMLTKGETADIFIFYHGTNDIFNKVSKGKPHYLYDSFNRISFSASLLKTLSPVVNHFAVVRLFKPQEIFILNKELLRANAKLMIVRYVQNLQFIKKLSQSYNFKYLCLWQPNIFSTNKKLTEEELSIRDRYSNLQNGFEIVNQLINDYNIKEDNFINITNAFDDIEESIFLDFAHVTSIGNEAIARRILKILMAKNIFNH